MTKALPLRDFRSVRHVLESDDWGVGGDHVSPTDQIDQNAWHEIMDLPDDVAVTTSKHYESELKLLNDLWGDWVKAVGDVANQDELFSCMLDALECFQCSTFNLLHGYYRSAIASLRTAIEAIVIGAYGNLSPTNKTYVDWKTGASELTFTPARKALLKLAGLKPAGWLLEDDKLTAQAFRQLCRFTHSRPDTSDGDLWESNGPICSDKGVKLTFDSSLQIYAICYLIVGIGRPGFILPVDSRVLFKLKWLDGHVQLSKAFHELGELRG